MLWEAQRKGDRTSGIRKSQSATAPSEWTTASGLCATIRRQRQILLMDEPALRGKPLHICTRSLVNGERVRYAPGPETDLRRRHPQVFYSALLSTSALDYAPHRQECPQARRGTSRNSFSFDAAEVSMSEALRAIAAAWL